MSVMSGSSYEMSELVMAPHSYNEDTDQCLICMRMLINPVQCLTCKVHFCNSCSKRWKEIKSVCPNRCSKKWRLKKSQKLTYKLRCPNGCKILSSPQQFASHLKECKQRVKIDEGEEAKRGFMCHEKHRLHFQSKIYEGIKCPCGELARAYCYVCTADTQTQNPIGFCCQCRTPPGLTKHHCPLNHKFKLADGALFTNIIAIYCDRCNKEIPHTEGCYNDRICHFALCMDCYQKSPEDDEAQPLSEHKQAALGMVIQGRDSEDLSPDYIPEER